MTRILMLDGQNLLHRARSGFKQGEHFVAFNFFRALRALVEQHEPTRVVMALEGHPKHRYELLPDYKANRRVDPTDDVSSRALADFHHQVDETIMLMRSWLPVSIVRHPDHEADDTIANIIDRSSTVAEFIVVSTDTDHIQLLNSHDNVGIYNPVRKAFLEWNPDDDYVAYKALKGDASDNIPGVRGFGEKTAMRWAKDAHSNPLKLTKLLSEMHCIDRCDYERNHHLVRFAAWTPEEAALMVSSSPQRDWDAVKRRFDEWGFASITKDGPWSRFVATLDPLFGSNEVP